MRLLIIAGPDSGKSFLLSNNGPMIMGRGRSAQFQLLDVHVSRDHCQFTIDGRKLKLADLGSAGGTYVNGQRVQQAELRNGDVLRIGQTHIEVECKISDEESTLVLPAAARPDPTPSPDLSEPGELNHLVGKRIGRFQLKQAMSEDAYGALFLAESNGELQVLRVIWPQFAENQREMHRFIAAFLETRLPSHENLRTEYDAGTDDGYFWVSSEYVEGMTAAEMIENGPSPPCTWKQGVQIALDTAQGLAHAYRHGLIHRHLTPRAITVTPSSRAKLSDVVFQQTIKETFAGRVVRPGKLVGEVDYMSPERTRGLEFVDTRSDIYSLGVIAYTLLTGRHPLEASSLPDLITKIRTAEPVRMSRHVDGIPQALETLIMQALAKRPEARFTNPEHFVRVLEGIRKGERR